MSHRLEQQDVVTVWSMKAGVVRKDAQLTLLPASQETEPIRSNSLLSLHFFFFFFWLCHMACGISVPGPRTEPRPWQ